RQTPVQLAQDSAISNRVFDRQPLVLSKLALEEIQQRKPLTIGAAVDQRFVCGHGRSRNRAWRSDRNAEVGASEIRNDLLKRTEEENLVFYDRSADGSAELLSMKIGEWLVVGGLGRKTLKPLIMKQAAVDGVGARFRDHIYNAAGGSAELGAGSARDHLEFLDRLQGDVDRGALTTCLFAEESIVVVSTVQADVIEYAALSGEVNFVTVRALGDGDAWGQRKQVLKLAPENRS